MASKQDLFQTALALRDSGYSQAQIARMVGLSDRTVKRWFAKLRDDPGFLPYMGKKGFCEIRKPIGKNKGGRPIETFLPSQNDRAAKLEEVAAEEAESAIKNPTGEDKIDDPETDEERIEAAFELARAGELLHAGTMISDASPAEWKDFGEIASPDFLKSWQCGRLFFDLAGGVHRMIALARVGIKPGDFEIWTARAANRVEPYATFLDLCSMAQASACTRMQKLIQKKTPGWQALTWSLEKLSPEIYSRRLAETQTLDESGFADVGDDNLKRTALAFIIADNDRKAAESECIDLEEIEGRHE